MLRWIFLIIAYALLWLFQQVVGEVVGNKATEALDKKGAAVTGLVVAIQAWMEHQPFALIVLWAIFAATGTMMFLNSLGEWRLRREQHKAGIANEGNNSLPEQKRKDNPSPRHILHLYPNAGTQEICDPENPNHVPAQILPYSPTPLTKEQAMGLIDKLKAVPQYMPIKIVATHACMAYAEELARIFSAAHFKVMRDADTEEQIFMARTERREVVVRYRKVEDSFFNTSCEIIASLLSQLAGARPASFPGHKNINYFQIEIGGAP